MLPFNLSWYRRLIGVAVILGVAGGIFGLVYLGGTGEVIDLFFGEADTSWWPGEWWWIPLIAVGVPTEGPAVLNRHVTTPLIPKCHNRLLLSVTSFSCAVAPCQVGHAGAVAAMSIPSR